MRAARDWPRKRLGHGGRSITPAAIRCFGFVHAVRCSAAEVTEQTASVKLRGHIELSTKSDKSKTSPQEAQIIRRAAGNEDLQNWKIQRTGCRGFSGQNFGKGGISPTTPHPFEHGAVPLSSGIPRRMADGAGAWNNAVSVRPAWRAPEAHHGARVTPEQVSGQIPVLSGFSSSRPQYSQGFIRPAARMVPDRHSIPVMTPGAGTRRIGSHMGSVLPTGACNAGGVGTVLVNAVALSDDHGHEFPS